MKKHLYWPFVILTVPLAIILLGVFFILSVLGALVGYCITMFSKIEWWICDCHKDTGQPLNPFNKVGRECE